MAGVAPVSYIVRTLSVTSWLLDLLLHQTRLCSLEERLSNFACRRNYERVVMRNYRWLWSPPKREKLLGIDLFIVVSIFHFVVNRLALAKRLWLRKYGSNSEHLVKWWPSRPQLASLEDNSTSAVKPFTGIYTT